MNKSQFWKFFFYLLFFALTFHWPSELKQTVVAETMAGMMTEVNYIIVYRVCFWRVLLEVLLEEAQYLCILELSKEGLLGPSSLVTTRVKKKLRKVKVCWQRGVYVGAFLWALVELGCFLFWFHPALTTPNYPVLFCLYVPFFHSCIILIGTCENICWGPRLKEK